MVASGLVWFAFQVLFLAVRSCALCCVVTRRKMGKRSQKIQQICQKLPKMNGVSPKPLFWGWELDCYSAKSFQSRLVIFSCDFFFGYYLLDGRCWEPCPLWGAAGAAKGASFIPVSQRLYWNHKEQARFGSFLFLSFFLLFFVLMFLLSSFLIIFFLVCWCFCRCSVVYLFMYGPPPSTVCLCLLLLFFFDMFDFFVLIPFWFRPTFLSLFFVKFLLFRCTVIIFLFWFFFVVGCIYLHRGLLWIISSCASQRNFFVQLPNKI